jgi:hypothetical protein
MPYLQPMAVMIAEKTLSINSLMASIAKEARFVVTALVLNDLVLFLAGSPRLEKQEYRLQ